MNKKILSLFVFLSMLLSMVSSAAATPLSAATTDQQDNQSQIENLVVRIYFTTQEELNQLTSRLDILEVNHEAGFILAILSVEGYSSMQQAGYRMEVDEDKTRLLNKPFMALPGQGVDTIPGFPCYRTVAETYQDMQDIENTHPDMAQIFDIGDSWDRIENGYPNGYDILALRLTNENFGNVDTKPTFFLMAEIHAREYTTAETTLRYAEFLINNYGIDPDVTWLLDYFRVYIVSMTNPDGRILAEAGDLWRKNIDNDDGCNDPNSWGTDLNRNHSFKWNHGGSSPYACDETYMGPSAGSEPEVQAIEQFVVSIFTDQRGPGDYDPAPDDTEGVFITLHSYAQVVLYPWGWSTNLSPNATDLATLGRKFGYLNDYQVCQVSDPSCMYTASGTSDDFAYGTLGIASYTYEIGTWFFEDCGSFESTVYPDNLQALFYAFKAARRPYQNPAGPESLTVSASPAAANPGEQVILTAVANDTRYNGGEPTQNIAEARYSIDAPSWITGTVTYPLTASDGTFNSKVENIEATIDTIGFASGRHTIFVESKDVNNNWGVPSAAFLYIVEPGVSPVIEGYVRDAGTNLPLAADVSGGMFNTTTDPATGYYSMTVISGTYDLMATATDFSPAYAYEVVAEDYATIQQDFLLYPYCSIYSDNVEGGVDWTFELPWAITSESSHSPIHSWTDSPGGNYGNDLDKSVTSKTFDFSSYTGITLSFWHKYITEAGWDYANVEYNAGSGWFPVATYDGNHNTWTQEHIQIPELDGQANSRIRFHLTSDSNTVYDGWHFDDVEIIGGGPSCVSLYPPVAEFSTNSPVDLGQAIQFTNLTTGTLPISYTWDFGDGTGTSTETNPVYTYFDLGSYTVTLTASNQLGFDEVIHNVTVENTAINSVNLAQETPGPIVPGDIVSFSADLSPDDATKPYSYTIDFGDGTVISDTSTLDVLYLEHIYSTSGLHSVYIVVWNAGMLYPVLDGLDVLAFYRNLLPLTIR